MPSPAHRRHRKNFNDAGHAHELTFCCYHGFQFLKAERTCNWLKESIDAAREVLDFALWAYVFMPEHVHLIVKHIREHAPEWLPRIARQRGEKIEHLFWHSGGGYDRNIEESKTLLSMIDYIHLNPVRRGLVKDPANWKWSSAAWYLLGKAGPITIDPIPAEWLNVGGSTH